MAAGLAGSAGWRLGRAAPAKEVCIAIWPPASSVLGVVGPLLQPASTARASRAGKQARPGCAKESGFKNMGKLNSEVGAGLIGQQYDASAVRGEVLMHDGQTNAAAARQLGRLALATVKRLENPLTVGRRHAHALVVNLNARQAGRRAQ